MNFFQTFPKSLKCSLTYLHVYSSNEPSHVPCHGFVMLYLHVLSLKLFAFKVQAHLSGFRENQIIAYAKTKALISCAIMKTKAQISCAVTAQLISAFVFATQIVQLFFLNPIFQAFSPFLGLYRAVCVGPGRKPRRPVFSRRCSFSNTRFVLLIQIM